MKNPQAELSMDAMTMRDYLAAKAMESLARDYSLTPERRIIIAREAYAMADCMLTERAKS